MFDLAKKHESKGGSLALFQADLLVEAPFESAAAGCLAFVHVASPVVGGGKRAERLEQTLRCCCTTAFFVDAGADLDLDGILHSIQYYASPSIRTFEWGYLITSVKCSFVSLFFFPLSSPRRLISFVECRSNRGSGCFNTACDQGNPVCTESCDSCWCRGFRDDVINCVGRTVKSKVWRVQ